MKLMQTIGRSAILATVLGLVGVCFDSDIVQAQNDVKKNTKFPQQILIIRHAEKTGEKEDVYLSKQGKLRAEALPQLFAASKERTDPFPTPDFIFAASNKKDSQRPIDTVTPLSLKLKLPINTKFESNLPAALIKGEDKAKAAKGPSMIELRDEIFGDPKYFGKTILISWRHGTLPQLAKSLKASNVPEKWEDDVFNRVWQINFDNEGRATFVDHPQRLMMGDSEK